MFFKKKAPAPQYNHNRKHDRVSLSIPVFLTINDGEPIQGEAEDVSLGGARIRCPAPLHEGELVLIEFRFAGMKTVIGSIVDVDDIDQDAPMRAKEKATVRWGHKDGSVGVQFINPSPTTQKLLKKIVRHFEEMKKQ